MKTKNLKPKESVFLLYAYISISAFLVMTVSEITKNLENVEKTIDFSPIVSLAIVLNMVTLATSYYYKKNIAQRG
jgi:fumarate reductase subunit C